jgi:CMP-2-keto-3-deoxyoctulosonic acid synthetase
MERWGLGPDNLPLVMWVYNRAKQSGVFAMVCVVTDDRRVHEAVLKYVGASCLTSPKHALPVSGWHGN